MLETLSVILFSSQRDVVENASEPGSSRSETTNHVKGGRWRARRNSVCAPTVAQIGPGREPLGGPAPQLAGVGEFPEVQQRGGVRGDQPAMDAWIHRDSEASGRTDEENKAGKGLIGCMRFSAPVGSG